MSQRRLLVSLGVMGLFAASARADVIVVPSGSPANAIATAVAAAVDGDVILVESGQYSGFVINGKGISVVAGVRANAHITGAIGVINVPADRDVLVSGLSAKGTEQGSNTAPPTSIDGVACYAFDNAGSVRVIGCDLEGGRGDTDSIGQSSPGGSAMTVNNSSDVVLSGTTLRGGPGGGCHTCWMSSGGDGGRALRSTNSFLALFSCAMHGGLGGEAGETSGHGGAGAEVGAGRAMFASNSIFEGGDGARSNGCEDTFFCCHKGIAGNGGNGLRLTTNAAAQILADVFTGGAGGFSSCTSDSNGGPGADVSESNSGGLFTFTVVPRVLDMPRIAREGDVVTLSFSGLAGDDVSVLFERETGFESIPSRRGILVPQHTGVGPDRWLRLGKIASTSTPLTHSFTVRELGPGVDSQTWHVQFMVRNTAGLILGSYSAIVYLDSSL
jgi:hypothetical protein